MVVSSHHTVGYDCRVDLNTDCVFGRAPELFYLQMLLDPLEEKLDLPPVVIEFSNHYWADSQSIGKEYELLLALFVQVDDSTDLVRVLLHRQLTSHVANRI